MSVTIEDYDRTASVMRADAIVATEHAVVMRGLLIIPVVLLPDRAAWLMRVPADELRALQPDWRFLTTADPTAERPALVRLDLWLPERRRLAIVWQASCAADFEALSYACLADRIVLRHLPEAHTARPGLMLRHIGLRDMPGFREVAGRVRAMRVLEAFPD